MISAQVTVTPNEAKRLISKAVCQMPEIQTALEKGKIIIKVGTSASAISEELANVPLRISGRIVREGALSRNEEGVGIRRLIIENGQVKDIETQAAMEEAAAKMGKNDVAIVGANAIDINRNAAIMVGAPLGGPMGTLFGGLISRGVITIIPVGWEKLIPCSIDEAIASAGREQIDMAMGMAVGLLPVPGIVTTETDAIEMLADVDATVIGSGGIMGAEGATTMVIQGEAEEVKIAWGIINDIKGSEVSGTTESLIACNGKSPRCASYETFGQTRAVMHRACVYREPSLPEKVFSA